MIAKVLRWFKMFLYLKKHGWKHDALGWNLDTRSSDVDTTFWKIGGTLTGKTIDEAYKITEQIEFLQ